MAAARIEALLAMLKRGQESALLRFSLGNEYAAAGELERAVEHLERAVALDPTYSAAWKLLGRSQAQLHRDDDAIRSYRSGIEIAERNGDRQAAKEMTVFLKRLLKAQSG